MNVNPGGVEGVSLYIFGPNLRQMSWFFLLKILLKTKVENAKHCLYCLPRYLSTRSVCEAKKMHQIYFRQGSARTDMESLGRPPDLLVNRAKGIRHSAPSMGSRSRCLRCLDPSPTLMTDRRCCV